jgi:hypothetical protein
MSLSPATSSMLYVSPIELVKSFFDLWWKQTEINCHVLDFKYLRAILGKRPRLCSRLHSLSIGTTHRYKVPWPCGSFLTCETLTLQYESHGSLNSPLLITPGIKADFVTSAGFLQFSNRLTSTNLSVTTVRQNSMFTLLENSEFYLIENVRCSWADLCVSHFDDLELVYERHTLAYMRKARDDLAWSQSANVFIAFHSLGHGVSQIIASGLGPTKLLQECSGFVTQCNLVILFPSASGLLLQREEVLLPCDSVSCCPLFFCFVTCMSLLFLGQLSCPNAFLWVFCVSC